MAACETCWTDASRRAAYTGLPVWEIYRDLLRQRDGWPDPRPCGGVSVNGADPKCCEIHMLPWGHKAAHPHEEDST